MITLEGLKDKINSVLTEVYSVQVYLVLKSELGLELKLADIESNYTTPEIKNMFSEYINDTIVNKEELELCKLSTADARQDAIYHYDYEEYPEELGIFRDFDISKATREVEIFDFLNDDLSKLYGYIIYLGSMNNGITLFKKHYTISLIKRDSFLLGAIKDKKRFEKIAGDDIIRLNREVELVCVEKEIYVISIKVLERNFGFDQLILKAANDSINEIDNLELLEDIEVLKDVIDNVTFARKLAKVKGSSPIINLRIPKEVIIEFTKTTDALAGKFKYSEDGSVIRLDTKKSKEAFIKLMNDSFLHSELTKQYYEAKAKDNITKEK